MNSSLCNRSHRRSAPSSAMVYSMANEPRRRYTSSALYGRSMPFQRGAVRHAVVVLSMNVRLVIAVNSLSMRGARWSGLLRLVEKVVCERGHELHEVVAHHDFGEKLGRGVVAPRREGVVTHRILDRVHLFLEDCLHQLARDGASVAQTRTMANPLPHLRTRNLCGGGVFHQVVERHAARSAQP